MKYSYFPGCSMESTAKSYRLATEYVMGRIGIELIEIKDWNCCGATSGHALNELLGLALPARSLAIAEREEPELDIVTGCASCYARLRHAMHKARTDNASRYNIEKTIEEPYGAKREVYNFLDILTSEAAKTAIRENVTGGLRGLKVACYYGCLNVRPAEVTGAPDRENPQAMDEIVALAGADPVDWAFKTECCGAAHQNDAASVTRPLVWRILKNAQANGAEAVVTACPMCNLNLEMRQDGYTKKTGGKAIPVFSVSELLAVAMGASAGRIALEAHHVPAAKVLASALRRHGEGFAI
ncbi:MAG: CoB--CoM heterodisulfide reductase iron-sulfur subunit B family protein [Clostridiales Family XIII bacterium]|jgi:heterodisulfide reductase subunit B|nr:CoB--CoM heterodisulfide reductase iron-sulfur subunit B family protein [Clostridiales Family XIII bacterium]